MANVLAVFAHPDDEVLGCGGTLAKHAENGDDVSAIVLCRRELEHEFKQAAKVLGIHRVRTKNWADQRLDRKPFVDIVGSVTSAFAVDHDRPDPDVIYTHHPGDLNKDHALTAQAVLTAFRPKPLEGWGGTEKPRTILACEVLSSTEWTFPQAFQPNWFVELTSGHLSKKVRAMGMYTTEHRPWPHPRNRVGIESLAHYRGLQCGVPNAEAFQCLRAGPF